MTSPDLPISPELKNALQSFDELEPSARLEALLELMTFAEDIRGRVLSTLVPTQLVQATLAIPECQPPLSAFAEWWTRHLNTAPQIVARGPNGPAVIPQSVPGASFYDPLDYEPGSTAPLSDGATGPDGATGSVGTFEASAFSS